MKKRLVIVELLKSIVVNPIRIFSGEIRSAGKIDYDEVLKNHGPLMNAYGSVRKRVSKTPEQMFYRSLFVESHIYKQLQSLKKIYLTEIAILQNTDNTSAKSALNKFVEDIDTLLNSLFHFPAITWKGFLSIIVSALAVAHYLRYLLSGLWPQNVNTNLYHTMITVVGMGVSIIIGLYLLNLALSFVDKRRFFLFPEYDALKFRDRMKKRLETFFGSKIERTIYEKENNLYQSVGVRKELELPIDLLIFLILTGGIATVFFENFFMPYVFLIIMFLLLFRRSTNRNNC